MGNFLNQKHGRNWGGFDEKNYLKTLEIHGTIEATQVKVIAKKQANPFLQISNQISLKIKEKIDKLLEKEKASLLKGILLGDTTKIEEDIKENFQTSNISHILAISGMHIAYWMVALNWFLDAKIGKRKTRFSILIFLFFYITITGFSPSVVRAGVMGILVTFAQVVYRKNDIYNSLAISLLCMLIKNPFLITNVGLQLSYLGTIGMIVLYPNVFHFFKSLKIKKRKWKYRQNRKIILLVEKGKEIIAVTLSAQLVILPMILYHFNIFSTYFLVTNLLVSIVTGPILIFGSILVLISFLCNPIAKLFSLILEFLIQILILVSNLGQLPLAKIYVPTPKVWMLIFYYVMIVVLNLIYSLYHAKSLNVSQIRARNVIAFVRYQFFQNKRKILKSILISIFIFLLIFYRPKNLKIHFVDVGQGDCTFVTTPRNKTILIDGGGSSLKDFDVGKSTLLPYVLDRGYTKIDFIFISHFDQDHVGGILTILEELKVGKVLICKQEENSENYEKFLKLVKEKKIAVQIVKKGTRIVIEKGLYFDILWPTHTQITENRLNNNSMVAKLCYQDFSMLFTGDIEEIAEKEIVEMDQEKQLNSNVLKIAHHGSKTSTNDTFLKLVHPQIAFIGVGKNNLFHHPSQTTLDKLKEYGTSIYRTDEKGEITITVNQKGKFLIKSKLP